MSKTFLFVFPALAFISIGLIGCDKPNASHPEVPSNSVHQALVPSTSSPTPVQVLRSVATHGDAWAQYYLGIDYESGNGVAQDLGEAARWYRLSAEQKNMSAETSLGAMYAKGQGVPQDYAEAIRWFRLAAAQGEANAQYDLGIMYANGKGVIQDALRAHMWWNLAAMQGNKDAAKDRDKIAETLTSDQEIEAQQMARYCQRSGYKRCGSTDIERAGSTSPSSAGSQSVQVPMEKAGGVYVVPVRINDALSLNFIVDSGAADVSIPADVVLTLVRTNTLSQADFIGDQTYTLADGSSAPSSTFRIRSLRIGNIELQNVVGSIGDVRGVPLLGQSFLSRFQAWSVDNDQHALVLSRFQGGVAEAGAPSSVPSATEAASEPSFMSKASFDCAHVVGAIEKLICSTADISADDAQMASLYATALGTQYGDQIKDEQRYWLKFVRSQCTETACLRRDYEARIAQLTTEETDSSLGAVVPDGTIQDIVSRFYRALAHGDGITASGLVVPAKRDGGPLSAGALTTFYSNLDGEFVLSEMQASAVNQATVHYRYVSTNGKACIGYSLVTLAERNSVPLIEKIDAPLGC